MMFENLDDDAWDRAIQPVFLKNEETGFNNTLNAMMDHIWDTFYTGQRRMARFPAAMLMSPVGNVAPCALHVARTCMP